MTKDERRKAIFSIDRDQILSCDIFLFILDGRVPDEGACVELGIAYTQKFLEKKNTILVGLHTDIRAAFLGGKDWIRNWTRLGKCFASQMKPKLWAKCTKISFIN